MLDHNRVICNSMQLSRHILGNPIMTASRLQQRTLELVRHRPRSITLQDISTATKVSIAWQKQFLKGKIDDPGVRKIEAVYEFLSAKPLEI